MSETIDLVLVKPGGRLKLFGSLAGELSGFAPPLDIGLIAGFLRKRGYSVRIIDADAEFLTPEETAQRIREFNPLLVGIFAHTIRMMHASETLKILNNTAPDIKTLLGGRHPSALPERTLREVPNEVVQSDIASGSRSSSPWATSFGKKVDFVCVGEAFYPLAQLLDILKSGKKVEDYKINGIWYLKNGKVISNPPAPLFKNLDDLPFIACDLLPMDKYKAHNWHCFDNLEKRQPYASVYTSIGCPFRCSYCCVNTVYGGSGIRYRSPEKVIEEIDYLVKNYNVRNIRFVDDIFSLRPERVNRICDLIIQRGYDLNIWVYARVDTVNEPMLKKMKQAGINWVCFGIEAGHEKVREGVYKRIAPDKIRQGIKMTQDAGIYINANFIFGLPDDNIETMQETLDMAKEFNFEYVNLYVAMGWPGSKLYEESVRAGVRLPQNWSGYAQLSEDTLPLPTKYLSAEEVLRFRDNAFVEYFSNPRYLEMMEQKFGPKVKAHIIEILKHKVKRKLLKTTI